jgi:C-terminal processing protease CtpA/Prc
LGQQPQKLDSSNREIAHMMLRRAYLDVKKNYYDPAYHGVDLDASYHQYDALLDSAQSVNSSFLIIAGFLAHLHDSHTFFMPPMRASQWTSGFAMEMIGDKCFVTRTRPGSDAEGKLHPGDEVRAFDSMPVNRADFTSVQYFVNVLSATQSHTVIVQSPAGEVRTETVRTMARTGKTVLDITGTTSDDSDFWKLVRKDEEDAHLNRERTYEIGDVLIWKMPSFMVDPDMVNSVFSKARKHKILILDLRGNPGGFIDTLKDTIGNVFDHQVTLGTRVSRKGSHVEMIKPKGNPFGGKLIVLIDSDSGSEIFARVIQLEHRGKVVGDRSAGAVMEASHFDESLGGDTRIFYGVSVTSANLIMTDGKSIENIGVTPDEVDLPTAEDLAEGKDPVLAHAADLAGVKLDPVAAGKLFPFEWPTL